MDEMIATAINIDPPVMDGVRSLQRKLYRKAKQAEDFRFYSLYDKLSRLDILQRAYQQVKANRGSPGLDGLTFDAIEQEENGKQRFVEKIQTELRSKTYQASPVKRVYIPKGNDERRPLGIPTLQDRVVQMAAKLVLEPIFEADFSDCSFGYRPKRQAHHAVDEISRALRYGHVNVIDADLSKYFDTIPHDKLLRTVAERVADGGVLSLLKQWLKVPIVEIQKGKPVIVGGGANSTKGTPQGGVISPLLANLYLNILDRIWRKHEIEKRYGAKLVRYADDMVILCKSDTEQPMRILTQVLTKLELTLNAEKTSTVSARLESFTFLGFSFQLKRSLKSGKWYPHIEPSSKSVNRFKEKVKWLTRRQVTLIPMDVLVTYLNRVLKGWENYFHYGNSHRVLRKVKNFAEERLRRQLCHRYKVKRLTAGYLKFPKRSLYEDYGLYSMNIKPLWMQAQAF